MSIINEQTNIYKYFKDENLVEEKVYKSKNKYIPLYINEELYEEIFNEKYDSKKAYKKIIDMFSITLDKDNAKEEIGTAYSDKQEDPMGISLSGNEGSGRAYFYGKCFNIKGDKTSLATSPKEIYSNGKYALGAAIKETVISNIISKELSYPSFETLAILDTTETFEYTSEYLTEDDEVLEEKDILPRVIEIRISKDKRLYRISNLFKNKDTITYNELQELTEKLASLEAEKYIKRFLHGSWSVGNISIDANLIDFDTADFVKGRHPQFSNTNKYKSNYFGFEILGSKMILKLLFENSLLNDNYSFNEIEKLLDTKYNEYLKIEFCKIIGLTYELDYLKHKSIIDELFDKFIVLSKCFFPNYYALNVLDKKTHKTFIYDFSNFFQNYLIGRTTNTDLLYGVKLLLNDSVELTYTKVGFIKEKVEEFFKEYIIRDNETSKVLKEAIEFTKLYSNLFEEIENINDIKYKQYILNMNRNYLYASDEIYGKLSYLYQDNRIDNYTLNTIIKHLIKTNIRNYNEEEYLCNLNINNNYLSYMVISKEYYYFVLVPYNNYDIDFAKLYINDEEYMFHQNKSILISDKIYYEDLYDIVNNPSISVNGIECNIEYINYERIDIKQILKEYYDIDAININEIHGGSTKCYCIEKETGKNFLKIYEKNTPIEYVIRENKILSILKRNNIQVPSIIKTNTNKIALSCNDELIILEDYIEGNSYQNNILPKNILLDSAALLGKMHNVLKREIPVKKQELVRYNSKEYIKNIDTYLKQLDKYKDDDNYDFIKEVLIYKKNKINFMNETNKKIKNITLCVSHGDYSKRQVICNNNEISGIVDFSSCEVVSISWEIIRSFILSTQTYESDINFDYDLFFNYIDNYTKENNLNYYDFKLMPDLLLYQILISNYTIKKYIESNKNIEDINFIKLKHKICLFLEQEKENISNKLINKYCKNNIV